MKKIFVELYWWFRAWLGARKSDRLYPGLRDPREYNDIWP